MKKIPLYLIHLYQKTIAIRKVITGSILGLVSDDDHPTCRFQPTCSQYTSEAINRYGIVKGALLGGKRVIRCHPWSPGGIDPVPNL